MSSYIIKHEDSKLNYFQYKNLFENSQYYFDYSVIGINKMEKNKKSLQIDYDFTEFGKTVYTEEEQKSLQPQGSKHSIGIDLRYAGYNIVIPPETTIKLPLGIKFRMPLNMFAKIEPRSSLNLKSIYSSTGIIDSDYNKEVHAVIRNLNKEPIIIQSGERICQIIFYEKLPIELTNTSFDDEGRGDGFGSSGAI